MINPQEQKRLLAAKAKHELEARGFGLRKLQSGEFLVINGKTEEPLVKFDTIEHLGQFFSLWGTEDDNGINDPISKADSPYIAAMREKIR